MKVPRTRTLVRVTAFVATLGLTVALTALPAAAAAPTVVSYSPTTGVPSQAGIVITGTGFFNGGATSAVTAVTFGGVAAIFSPASSDTSVTATVPCTVGIGSVAVAVTTPGGGPIAGPATFVVTAPAAPSPPAFVPATGPVGTVLKITGSNFTCASSVTVGALNTPATSVTVVSATEIRATVAGGTTTGVVRVITPGGTGTSVGSFTVSTAPVINSFAPTTGAAGTVVDIFGLNFTNPPTVRFNGVQATTVSFISATNIRATVPSGATTGLITATATGGTATSLDTFTVTGPSITSFSPTTGPVGTSVVINGSNLTGATLVRFNGVSATPFTVNSTGTQITTTVPTGATSGLIQVVTSAGTATSATSFTVTGSASHGRSVTLNYSGHRARGQVSVTDGSTQCRRFVPVRFQRLQHGDWNTVDTIATNGSGAYNGFVPNVSGKVRTRVPKLTLADGSVCGADSSPVRRG